MTGPQTHPVDHPAAQEIATLPPAPVAPPHVAPVHPRTGSPRRPWSIWLAAVLLFAAAIVTTVALGFIWWDMASPWQETTGGQYTKTDRFASAAWLAGAFTAPQGSWVRVALAIAVTAIVFLIAAVSTVVAYYAFAGYRWTRIGGLVAIAVSLMSLTLTPLAWAAIGCAAVGASALWLPATRRFFDSWLRLRHPEASFSAPVDQVLYGPVRRFG